MYVYGIIIDGNGIPSTSNPIITLVSHNAVVDLAFIAELMAGEITKTRP